MMLLIIYLDVSSSYISAKAYPNKNNSYYMAIIFK